MKIKMLEFRAFYRAQFYKIKKWKHFLERTSNSMIYPSFSMGCGFMILTNLKWLMHDCKPEVKDTLISLVLLICISQHVSLFFIYLLFCVINTVLQLKQFSDICRHGKAEVSTGLIIFLPRFITVRLQSVKHHFWKVFSKELPLFLWNVE